MREKAPIPSVLGRRAIAFSFVCCALLTGCIADSGFKARGSITLRSGKPPSDCALRLYLHSNQQLLDDTEIEPDFVASFVIAPWERDYYMEVQCAGTSTHRTQKYRLGNVKWYLNPVDLGTIVLDETTLESGSGAPRPSQQEDMSVGRGNALCKLSTLPSGIQDQLRVKFSAWKILEPADLGPHISERWNAEKPLQCPGLAIGESHAVVLVPKASPKTAYRILIFAHRPGPPNHEYDVLDQSDEGGADNLFIRSVDIKVFFNEESRKKFGVAAQQALLVVFASETEYQADVYFRTDGHYRREPVDY